MNYIDQNRNQIIETPKTSNNDKQDCFLPALLERLRDSRKQEVYLKEAEQKYNIRPYKIHLLTTHKAQKEYQMLFQRFYYRLDPASIKQRWCDNELRFYIWALVMYLGLEQKQLHLMTSEEWEIFTKLLNNKSETFIIFQAQLLIKSTGKSKKWSDEEQQMLSYIIKRNNNNRKWHKIAKQLFSESDGKFMRTPKQCRQKWMNYLDPEILRQPWEPHEDIELLQKALVFQKKWSKISKALSIYRTEHSVKNRYYSLLRPYLTNNQHKREKERIIYLLNKIKKKIARKEQNLQTTHSIDNPVANIQKSEPNQPSFHENFNPSCELDREMEFFIDQFYEEQIDQNYRIGANIDERSDIFGNFNEGQSFVQQQRIF